MQFAETANKHSPALWELYLEADPQRGAVLEYLSASRVYTLTNGKILLGAACVLPLTPSRCELKNLAVRADARGQGIGALLCRHVFAACRALGFKHITVGTADVSAGPLAFYAKLGFTQTGVRKDFFIQHYREPVYDQGKRCHDMIVLEKNL